MVMASIWLQTAARCVDWTSTTMGPERSPISASTVLLATPHCRPGRELVPFHVSFGSNFILFYFSCRFVRRNSETTNIFNKKLCR